MENDAAHPPSAKHRGATRTRLSYREIAFLRLTSEGKTAGQIAAAMAVSERTANFHISNAMDKLGALNKTHAVALAMRWGLLD